MNKKLIALAVVGAVFAPAVMAQTANPVTLYGRAYVGLESVKADGGSAVPIGSRLRVSNLGPSMFGIRGTEDLGDGLKAFFQMETQFTLDQNDAAGAASTFATRNSGVGLQGGFGSVLLGRWDTPFKVASAAIDPFGDTTLGGYTAAMSDRGNFNVRQQNVVQYWTPNLSGFQARVAYGVNEGKTATVNPSQFSWNATYTQGPIYVGYAWERHKDQFKGYTVALAAIQGAQETGQSLFGAVTFGPLKVGLMTQRFKKNAGPTAAVQTTDIKSNMAALTYTAGQNQFVYTYQNSKDGLLTTAAVQPNCKVNTVGYFYNFSKRTSFLGQYAQIKNNTAGLCNFGANTLAIAADQDPQGFTIGLRHLF